LYGIDNAVAIYELTMVHVLAQTYGTMTDPATRLLSIDLMQRCIAFIMS